MNLLRERAYQRDAVHIGRRETGHFQRARNSGLRQSAGRQLARHFTFFDRRHQFAVLQHRAGGVFIEAAQSENDHLDFFSDFFSILAQVSRSATVRLNTSFSDVVSGSTEKYPSRSN